MADMTSGEYLFLAVALIIFILIAGWRGRRHGKVDSEAKEKAKVQA